METPDFLLVGKGRFAYISNREFVYEDVVIPLWWLEGIKGEVCLDEYIEYLPGFSGSCVKESEEGKKYLFVSSNLDEDTLIKLAKTVNPYEMV